MNTFQYQLLRFLPDRVSGEFINLGVVVYDSIKRNLEVEICEKTARLSQVFPNTNTRYISKVLKHIEHELILISSQLKNEFEFEYYSELNQITKKVLPKDDSALFFSETEKIIDIEINAASSYLFDRMVNINHTELEKEYKNDKEVWSKVYKEHFDRVNISKYLKPAQIQTKFDTVTFEHSWRNGHLNFFESVNFDLAKTESIRNKVFRWAGQIDELDTAKENSHLYLLTILPKDDINIHKFITEFLSSKTSSKVQVEVVTQTNISKITGELQKEISEYQNS